MNFLQKLDFLMDRFGLNKRTLSQNSDIPYTTIDGWYKKGYEGLKLTTLRKLAEYFNTTLDYWILDDVTDPNHGKASGFKLEVSEMEHIKKYRTLDGYGKKMVDMILELEIQRLADQAAEDELAPNVIELPLFDQPASAGYGNWLDETSSDLIPVPDTPTTRRADFCIRVSGDSMEPKYADGDLVFVRKQDDVPVGDFGIWVIDGSAYIKQRAADSLHSLNPEYDDVEQGENVFCVGKVIGKL